MLRLLSFLLVTMILAGLAAAPADVSVRSLKLPLVGAASAYLPPEPTSRVELLVSGRDGWTPALDRIARHLAGARAIVIGISFPALQRAVARRSGCWYAAADLELLSHEAQRLLDLPVYTPPVLIGYADGAATVYAALAPAPVVTFAGAVSLAFSPELPVARRICPGDAWRPRYDAARHADDLPPAPRLPKDWYVIQGSGGHALSMTALTAFTRGMPRAHVIGVDERNDAAEPGAGWLPALDRAVDALWTAAGQPTETAPPAPAIGALEAALNALGLSFEFRLPADPRAFVVFVSGDGGWASIDQNVSQRLAARGIGVVGLSSLRYFWRRKTPAQVATDLGRIVRVLAPSGRPIFAGGYSFGAEVVPVVLPQMPEADRRKLGGLVLLAPGLSASFEINPLDWVRTPKTNPHTLVAPAIRGSGLPAICLDGADEKDSGCTGAQGAPGVQVVKLPGGHHFDRHYDTLADAIVSFVQAQTPGRRPS